MLKVNEIFGPTIQGEGKSVGKNVSFLRMTNCNLHCVYCDTPYTWDWNNHDRKSETHEQSIEQVFALLESLGVSAVVVSGGEPMLQQKELILLFRLLKQYHYWIEVETNGTVPCRPEFGQLVDQFNCSPKLSNAGDPKQMRVKKKALHSLIETEKATFKFVVDSENDINEVLEYTTLLSEHSSFDTKSVYLMPKGKTVAELNETRDMTVVLCQKYNFNFSDRLHVIQFGGVRGV